MDLKQHLRIQFNNKIRPIYLKNKCECCDENENLHLHHVNQFSTLLNETFEVLNISYEEDINKYSKLNLDLIECIMLGKQLKANYVTVCHECHKKVHLEEGKDWSNYHKWREKQRVVKEKKFENKVHQIHTYLINNINKRLLMSEVKDLFKGFTGRTTGLNSINKFLSDNNLNYYIESKQTSKWVDGKIKSFRYWEIIHNEVQSNAN